MEKKPTKEDLIEMLDEMIKTYEGLPERAMMTAINHYDLLSFMYLVSAVVKSNHT